MSDLRTSAAEQILEAIQVPDEKYESANRTFHSLCEWFRRPESSLIEYDPDAFLQGSFRLGTAIRPLTDDDDYDLDIVCSLHLAKSSLSQADLKELVGKEVRAYSRRHSMKRPTEGRRCWTQEYSDGSQFHVDTLPAIPDADRQREVLNERGLNTVWSDTAIAITDKTNPNYYVRTDRWPLSNPRGYAAWFESRMGSLLRKRKEAIALRERRSAEDIPTYRARLPLQSAVQLLKFHRNVMFADDSDNRPISAILTTLAARSYGGELTLAEAIRSILSHMDEFIEDRLGVSWVVNPTNELENFADKWIEFPHRRDNFYRWLDAARVDFARLESSRTMDELRLAITEVFGQETADRWQNRRAATPLTRVFDTAKRRLLQTVAHRQAPPWTPHSDGSARVFRATKKQRGYRSQPLSSDGSAVSKGSELHFYGRTDVPPPYEIYWQIVNTGADAERARNLRGGFQTGSVFSGGIIHKENASYSGSHSAEFFVVKDNYLAARSGLFIVNVR